MDMRIVIVSVAFFLALASVGGWGLVAHAEVTSFLPPVNQNDLTPIAFTALPQIMFGTLQGEPRMFTLELATRTPLSLQIFEPAITASRENVSSIVIKIPERGGRVTEVARLEAKEATWDTLYDFYTGDTYRKGPTFSETLEPGTYHIEIHTPDNLAKYVLIVSTESNTSLRQFASLTHIREVKTFFEKSKMRVLEGPFIGIPLLAGIIFLFHRYRRRSRDIQ